jgi:hypothetical protein
MSAAFASKSRSIEGEKAHFMHIHAIGVDRGKTTRIYVMMARRNPERFPPNHADLSSMCEATLALGLGAYMLKSPGCTYHANRILSTWFIEPQTK